MHSKTNVKSIKSFIKHLDFRPQQRACWSPVQWPFLPRCHVASCIITGASTWMGTALNKAYFSSQPAEMDDVASEHKAISAWPCEQIYNAVTWINMPDSQTHKCHMSIIKTFSLGALTAANEFKYTAINKGLSRHPMLPVNHIIQYHNVTNPTRIYSQQSCVGHFNVLHNGFQNV